MLALALTAADIGMSVALARNYFFQHCEGFSMAFASLVGRDGELFRKQCKDAGKKLFVWTVNKRPEVRRRCATIASETYR